MNLSEDREMSTAASIWPRPFAHATETVGLGLEPPNATAARLWDRAT